MELDEICPASGLPDFVKAHQTTLTNASRFLTLGIPMYNFRKVS